MAGGVFGNLEEWGGVLDRLEELTGTGQLEQHQGDLVRLLRYPDNWRLREAGLEAAATVGAPTTALVRQLLRLTMDRQLYHQARVLAAEALGAAFERLRANGQIEALHLQKEVGEQMRALLSESDVPVLHQAVRRILPAVG